MLVGNKCDLEEDRTVTADEAMQYAEDNSLNYIETSALQGSNVDSAFLKVIECKHWDL